MNIVRGAANRLESFFATGVAGSLFRYRGVHEEVDKIARKKFFDEQAIFKENYVQAGTYVHVRFQGATASAIFQDLFSKTGVSSEVEEMIKAEEKVEAVLERNDDVLLDDLKDDMTITQENVPRFYASLLARSSEKKAKIYLDLAISVKEESKKNETEESKISPQSKEEFDQLKKKHEEMRAREGQFKQLVDEIYTAKISPQERCKRLEALLYRSDKGGDNNLRGIDRLNSHELKRIFFALWDNKGYDQMVEMMFTAKKAKFKESPFILEIFGRALIESSYFNPHVLHELGEHLSNKFGHVPEFYAIRALAERKVKMNSRLMLETQEKRQGDQADNTDQIRFNQTKKLYQSHVDDVSLTKEDITENYIVHLAKATTHFRLAFELSQDPRYGYSLMHSLLEQGDFQQAEEVAQMVEFCCARDGGLLSENFYILRCLLGASYLLEKSPEEIEKIETVLMSMITTPLLAERCLKDLDNMGKFVESESVKRQVDSFRNKVLKHKMAIENPKKEKAAIEEKKNEANKILAEETRHEDQSMRLFRDYSGQFSNWRPGNWQFGGQLPSSNINRFDRMYFGKMIQEPLINMLAPADLEGIPPNITTLADIPDIDMFCKIAHRIIRAQYNTADLERYDEKHDDFDKTVHGYMAVTGAEDVEVRKYLPDSRTNIAEHFRRGIGDCRAHTQTLQLLHEMWKEFRYNDRTNQLQELLVHKDLRDHVPQVWSVTDDMESILKSPLRFIDVEVHIPVKKDAKGYPVWHGDRMVMNDSGKPVKAEEHTLNVAFVFDEKNDLQKIVTKDSFYHNTYPWENQELTFKGRDFATEGYFAGYIEMYNESRDEVVKVPIIIKPTSYTGQTPEYNKNSEQPRFMGIPVPVESLEKTLLEQRDENRQQHQAIRSFYEGKNVESKT